MGAGGSVGGARFFCHDCGLRASENQSCPGCGSARLVAPSSLSLAEEDVSAALGASLANLEIPIRNLEDSRPGATQAACQSLCAQLRQVTVRSIPENPSGENACSSTSCAICTSDYVAGDKVTHLPCGHAYHTQCVQPWFSTHQTCPVCRAELSADGRVASSVPPVSESPAPSGSDVVDRACPTPEFLAVASALATTAAPEPAIQNNLQRQVWEVHFGVQCAGCNVNPVVGNRFRCSTCEGLDFCEACTAQHLSAEHSVGRQHNLNKMPGLAIPVADVLAWLRQLADSGSLPSRSHPNRQRSEREHSTERRIHPERSERERCSERHRSRVARSASPVRLSNSRSRKTSASASGRSAFASQQLPIALGQVVLTRGAGNSLRMSGRVDGRPRPQAKNAENVETS